MKFSEVRQGDSILTLEQDRRSQFPIFDIAKVQKISQPSYRRLPGNDNMVQVVIMTLSDSTGTFEAVVPLDAEDTIFDKIYLTPNPSLIQQEIFVQKSRARSILENVDRYKAIDAECDKILAALNPNQSRQQSVAPDLNNQIIADLTQQVQLQGKMLEKIYSSLFTEETAKNNG